MPEIGTDWLRAKNAPGFLPIGPYLVPAAFVGASLFYLSDATIGWSRFVKDFRSSGLVIITTYHAAQLLLVTSLLVAR